jgi:hypothetical protein
VTDDQTGRTPSCSRACASHCSGSSFRVVSAKRTAVCTRSKTWSDAANEGVIRSAPCTWVPRNPASRRPLLNWRPIPWILEALCPERGDLAHHGPVLVIDGEGAPIGFGANDHTAGTNGSKHLVEDRFWALDVLQGAIHLAGMQRSVGKGQVLNVRVNPCDSRRRRAPQARRGQKRDARIGPQGASSWSDPPGEAQDIEAEPTAQIRRHLAGLRVHGFEDPVFVALKGRQRVQLFQTVCQLVSGPSIHSAEAPR